MTSLAFLRETTLQFKKLQKCNRKKRRIPMEFPRAQQLVNKNDVKSLKALPNPLSLLHLRHKKSGDTLLHICCRCGSQSVLSYIIDELGANVEVSNNDGKRPLHDAAQNSEEGCLSILLYHGAETNVLKRSDWYVLERYLS